MILLSLIKGPPGDKGAMGDKGSTGASRGWFKVFPPNTKFLSNTINPCFTIIKHVHMLVG